MKKEIEMKKLNEIVEVLKASRKMNHVRAISNCKSDSEKLRYILRNYYVITKNRDNDFMSIVNAALENSVDTLFDVVDGYFRQELVYNYLRYVKDCNSVVSLLNSQEFIYKYLRYVRDDKNLASKLTDQSLVTLYNKEVK